MAEANRGQGKRAGGTRGNAKRSPSKSGKGTGRKTAASGRSGKKGGRSRGSKGSRARQAVRAAGILRRVATWSLVAVIWISVIGAGVLAWYAYDLPEVGAIEKLTRRPNITLVAADGSTLASFGDRFGATRSLQELPPHLPRAVIAVEDRRFYDHVGIDYRGLLRAVFVNIRDGRISQGGSTLTQQLAKNLFLTSERTLKRKIQEVMLAIWLERRFTKDQILTIYLNRVYLGAGTYGMDAAARHYFGKPATKVTLYEAALLAGLLKAPSRLNPTRDPAGADQRAALGAADHGRQRLHHPGCGAGRAGGEDPDPRGQRQPGTLFRRLDHGAGARLPGRYRKRSAGGHHPRS